MHVNKGHFEGNQQAVFPALGRLLRAHSADPKCSTTELCFLLRVGWVVVRLLGGRGRRWCAPAGCAHAKFQIGCGWRFMPWSLGVLAIITPLINRLRSFFFVFFQRRNPALLLSGLGMAGGPTVAPANHSRVATTAKTAAWALEHQCHRPGLYSGLGARRTRFFWCFFS